MAHRPDNPVTPVLAIVYPGFHDARIGAVPAGKTTDRSQVALEIAARDSQPGRKIGELSNPAIELERRCNFRPIGADGLAQLRQSVGNADRCHKTAVDRYFGEFRALIA